MITAGSFTDETFSSGRAALLDTIQTAAKRGISLVQLREKALSARNMFDLAAAAADITRGTGTGLLINDRADIAAASGADGVHLTSKSIGPDAVRRIFGSRLIIGVSTHSADEVLQASASGADLAVFGPVFDSPGKGDAAGLDELARVCRLAGTFPVIALGGISEDNFDQVLAAGAQGAAGIRWFADAESGEANEI